MAAEHGYERLTPLATGGMAELLLAVRASTPGFRKLVVLKRVLPVHAAEPSFTRMFLREARIAASLDHPNVVQVYDSGWSDGRTFLAMEYVHGADLRQLIRAVAAQQQVVPLPFVLTIMAGLCAGLHYVHERCSPQGEPQGLVHRDVSPSNVLISEEGAVKLADFGVAAATAESIATRSGSIKGKLAYMAPEQARGESIDRRADIFGLGAVLYELSTGHRPFRAANDAALLYRVLEAQPERPSTLVADYPPQLEAIVMRALAKDPAARQPTAQVLQLELEELALSQGLPLSPTRLGHYVVQCCGAKASPTLLGEPGGTAVGPAAADLDRVSSTVTATRSRRLWPWATVAAAVVLLVVWGAAVWTADAGSEREDPAGASGSAVVAAPSSDAEVGTQPPPVARLPAAQAETTASDVQRASQAVAVLPDESGSTGTEAEPPPAETPAPPPKRRSRSKRKTKSRGKRAPAQAKPAAPVRELDPPLP